MTKRNKILTLAICLIYMFSAVASAAAGDISVQVEDGINGIVKISGTAPSGAEGEVVTLLVTNNAAGLNDAEEAINTAVQYQDTVVTGAEGRFEKTFTLYIPGVTEATTFKIFAGGEGYDGEVVEASLYYAPVDAKLAAAKAVCEEADAALCGGLIETNKLILAIDEPIYNALDKTKLATLLKTKLDGVSFLELTPENLEANIAEYTEFEAALKLAIALEGFNQNKKAQVLSGSIIANDALLGLTAYAQAQGTLNTIYTTKITAAGVTAALEGLFGKNASSAEDLKKVFAKQILVQGIKNNKSNGSGIVATVLTEENLAAAGYDVATEGEDTLKSEYIDLSDKSNANNDIYQKRNSLTAENLEAEIIASATKDYSDSLPDVDPAGPSGSTGSIGVGSGVVAPKEVFSDLAGYDWAKAAIRALAEKNIINGVGGDKFNPAGTLTREQAAKIICLAVGIEPSAEGTPFTDVAYDSWCTPYIAALNKQGIINGVSETSFGIGSNVTREDFAVMICRALNFTASGNNNFKDKDSISAYALDAVTALYERGIVGGYEDGSFKPQANISRAEGAKIIYGILSK